MLPFLLPESYSPDQPRDDAPERPVAQRLFRQDSQTARVELQRPLALPRFDRSPQAVVWDNCRAGEWRIRHRGRRVVAQPRAEGPLFITVAICGDEGPPHGFEADRAQESFWGAFHCVKYSQACSFLSYVL